MVMFASVLLSVLGFTQSGGSLDQGLAIPTVGNPRSAIRLDPIEAHLLAGGGIPSEGEAIGNFKWKLVKSSGNGVFEDRALGPGYLGYTFDVADPQPMVLRGTGYATVLINGEPRGGDPYSIFNVPTPFMPKAGRNLILFVVGRGRIAANLLPASKPVFLENVDLTLPDIRPGDTEPMWGAMPVVVASAQEARDLKLVVQAKGGKPIVTVVRTLGPLSTTKVGFRIDPRQGAKQMVQLVGNGQVLDSLEITLGVKSATEPAKCTFVSGVDGTVQYYGYTPSLKPDAGQALVLSLHGASVEAIGQAASYHNKDWAHIVAPTNRRPYGFDWEEIGRLDAIEVLDIAQKRYATNPLRTYLTGHSMGGHGTWQVSAQFPNRFAALAPSAGWQSFSTYGGGKKYDLNNPIERVLAQASRASDTLALKENYRDLGIFVLHGDADDNVPVSEARNMKAAIAPWHTDFGYYEQPGAGHWWDDDRPGAACVDFPDIFSMFRRRSILAVDKALDIDFTSASLAINADYQWLQMLQSMDASKHCRAQLKADPRTKSIQGVTTNLRRFRLNPGPIKSGETVTIRIDGASVQSTMSAKGIELVRAINGAWTLAKADLNPAEKYAGRYGAFKDVFRNRVTLVYGTGGTPEERAMSYAKARYDAETLWVRGNASPEVIADTAYSFKSKRDDNVVLYGHQGIIKNYDRFVDSVFSARSGELTYGDWSAKGGNLAFAFVRPKVGSKKALVGVVGGTGPIGMRLVNRLPYFTSGVGMPDYFVFQPKMLTEGTAGVELAGFFDHTWK